MASLGLVADYNSDSDSDSDSITQAATPSNLPVRNPLGTQDTDSSSEDESEDSSPQSDDDGEKEDQRETSERLPNPLAGENSTAGKLPPPVLGGSLTTGAPGSVFLNPFLKAEEAKQSVLEKHVKMTNYVEEEETKEKRKKRAKDKRKICHRFIKGNCKYGNKCRFSHNLGTKAEETVSETANTDRHAHYGNRSWHEGNANDSSVNDDDSYLSEAKRKKRVGVTDHLVPPKKAMKVLEQQRATERPWTVNQS